jgi:hypothetical protein
MFKLVLTVLATAVLLLKLEPITFLAGEAAKDAFSSADLAGLRMSLLVHAAGGLLVLLVVLTLAIYKPAGKTPFRGGDGSAPRWVKASAILTVVVLVLLAAMLLSGSHGPSSHM